MSVLELLVLAKLTVNWEGVQLGVNDMLVPQCIHIYPLHTMAAVHTYIPIAYMANKTA